MNKHARVIDGTVAEVFMPPEGFTLADCFFHTVAAQFVACPAEVEPGWTFDGSVWAAPVIEEPAL